MEKLLKPERFDIEPSTPNSEKSFKHWKTTFMNYLETHIPQTTEQDASIERKKLFALVNSVSASVY